MRRWGPWLLLSVLLGCNGDMLAYFAADVVDTSKDIAYVSGTSSPRQYLDVYTPRGGQNFPVVVFVHGGYWIAQDKAYFAPITGLYGNVGRALARRGVGAVVINYRLVPDVAFAEQLGDVIAAVRWTQANVQRYGGDPKRMVVSGHSAGGHMTALLAVDPARRAAAGGGRRSVVKQRELAAEGGGVPLQASCTGRQARS
jgi:acetyl esterase/lipase